MSKRKHFALFGNPVGHSMSPLMHNEVLSRLKIPGHYLAFCVEDIAAAIQGIRGLNLAGVSVTLPFKTEVMAFLDEINACAAEIGAVNTIKNEAGKLVGFNTDWIGLVQSMKAVLDIAGKTFIILGSGGAARAAIYGIKREGGFPVVVSRTLKKGRVLASRWDILYGSLNDLTRMEAHGLINTTPVGMAPNVNDTPLPKEVAARFPCVMDMIYNPTETRLLRDAREAGSVTINGVGMFVHQGAEQFRIWTGLTPPIECMRQVVDTELLKRQAET